MLKINCFDDIKELRDREIVEKQKRIDLLNEEALEKAKQEAWSRLKTIEQTIRDHIPELSRLFCLTPWYWIYPTTALYSTPGACNAVIAVILPQGHRHFSVGLEFSSIVNNPARLHIKFTTIPKKDNLLELDVFEYFTRHSKFVELGLYAADLEKGETFRNSLIKSQLIKLYDLYEQTLKQCQVDEKKAILAEEEDEFQNIATEENSPLSEDS